MLRRRPSRITAPTLSEMNITPLVDVMLVLLVIFMITTPVLAHRIDLDLPQEGPPPPPVPIVTLVIAADGSYVYDGQPLLGEALAQQLSIEAKRAPQPELTIDASRSVPYQQVATVLAAAHAAGLKRIGFSEPPR